MKKVLFFSCLLCGALALTSCDEDEVAKKYPVTVTVSADGADISSLKEYTFSCTNESGTVMKAETTDGFTYTYNLIAGNYTLQGFASNDEFNFNGISKFAVVDQEVKASLLLTPSAKTKSGIIFKEVYFYGVPSYYFKDGFYELVNNSDEVQYLDGIVFTLVDRGYGATDSQWADSLGNIPADFYPLNGYVWQFPGTGKDYPLEPGETTLIATQAYNHGSTGVDPRELTEEDEESPAGDLSAADWELNIPSKAVNYDNPNVESLNIIWSNATTIVFMPTVFGMPFCLAKLPDGIDAETYVNDSTNYRSYPGSSKAYLTIPRDCILDAIDIQRSGEEKIVKVFWPTEDAGYTYGVGANPEDPDYSTDFESWTDPAYSGKSLRRKCTMVNAEGRAYFKDTNNSLNDFILGGQRAVPRRKFSAPDKD